MIALVNQGRATAGKTSLGTGQTLGTNTVLYNRAGAVGYTNSHGDYYDVTSGSNGNPARGGYDLVTGLGTPVGTKIVQDLISS
jgi:hypothetical protein